MARTTVCPSRKAEHVLAPFAFDVGHRPLWTPPFAAGCLRVSAGCTHLNIRGHHTLTPTLLTLSAVIFTFTVYA